MNSITAFKINGTSPFYSPADNPDALLAQAHGMLTLLAGAHDTCQAASADAADHFDNIRPEIAARALEGVASLVALAQHFTDVARADRQPAHWTALVAAYKAASKALADSTTNADDVIDKLADAQTEAFDALMLAPAPNAAALAFKLATFAKITNGDAWHVGEEILTQLAADARRLA